MTASPSPDSLRRPAASVDSTSPSPGKSTSPLGLAALGIEALRFGLRGIRTESGLRPVPQSELAPAEWIRDCSLSCPPTTARAAVIMIGGFTECGPNHYQHLGPLLHDRSLYVALTNLCAHNDGCRIDASFSAENVMNKAVHDVQEIVGSLQETTPLVFVGFSLGALVALQLAHRFSFCPLAGVITEGAYLKGANPLRSLYQCHIARKSQSANVRGSAKP